VGGTPSAGSAGAPSAGNGGAATGNSAGSSAASGGAPSNGSSGTGGGGTASGGGSNMMGTGGVASDGTAQWRGVNLSSAEWGTPPGTYGMTYTYPTHAEIDRYSGMGMKIFRFPFAWERLQTTLGGALDATELARLDDVVTYATQKGAHAIIDVHNYAAYNMAIIGAGSTTAAHLADLWSKLAAHYASNSLVIFGLMNEPHDITVSAWLDAANGAIAAIRAANAKNLILVPGTNWTGAGSWTTSNSAMLGVVDSGNNYVYEVHQYLDADSSGSHATCVSATIGTERITSFANWLATNHRRAFLGEFGAGASADTKEQDQTCADAMNGMLTMIESHPELWAGWTYWAGGPWWQPGTAYTLVDDATSWQLTALQAHL